MPPVVLPHVQFREISEAEIHAAVAAGDPQAPIPQELARLLDAYTHHYAEIVRRLGYIPGYELRNDLETPIERVAMAMMQQAFHDLALNKRFHGRGGNTKQGEHDE